MKVTIDTKEDSHEDIQKILHILVNVLQHKGPGDHIQRGFSDTPSKPADTTNMMSMFANPSGTVTGSSESVSASSNISADSLVSSSAADTAPDFNAFLNLANKEEEKKEDTKIEFF